MRIKKFEAFRKSEFSDSSSKFTVSFSEKGGAKKNFFSILIGANGSRKSRTLRDILDAAIRKKDGESAVKSRFGLLEFLCDEDGFNSAEISNIIALSGVATDRFPSRIQTKGRQHNFYRYVGPRTENNLVSRVQSINHVASCILEFPDRIEFRKRHIKQAFSLLKLSSGILFHFLIAKPDVGKWTRIKIIDHISESQKERLKFEGINLNDLVTKSLRLLNSKKNLELRLDLDDMDTLGILHQDNKVIRFLLANGLISVRESYVLGDWSRDGELRTLSEFSSGEWHILSSLLTTAIAVEDNTLILIDEPENSLHPAWQQSYLRLLRSIITCSHGVQVIVATHSPLVAASLSAEHGEVICLQKKGRDDITAKALTSGPFGWTSDEILQEVFRLDSSRSIDFRSSMDRALSLFAKGDRNNPELIRLVKILTKTLPDLPEDDVAREVIQTLMTVVQNASRVK